MPLFQRLDKCGEFPMARPINSQLYKLNHEEINESTHVALVLLRSQCYNNSMWFRQLSGSYVAKLGESKEKPIFREKTLLKPPMLVSSVTRGNSLRQVAFRPVKPNWQESRTGKIMELKLLARARELANSDRLMKVIVGANCNLVERLARCCARYYCQRYRV